jgi:hypothetical protein
MRLSVCKTATAKYPTNNGSRCTPIVYTWLIAQIKALVHLMVYFPSVYLLDTPPFVVGRGLRRSDWRQFKWTPSVINLPMQQFLDTKSAVSTLGNLEPPETTEFKCLQLMSKNKNSFTVDLGPLWCLRKWWSWSLRNKDHLNHTNHRQGKHNTLPKPQTEGFSSWWAPRDDWQ